ncbi:MAG TPA: hypothetical protein VMA53_24165 [Stellaceae bacterium]|nr:hypothetical protein [Stellaceae bacterium]
MSPDQLRKKAAFFRRLALTARDPIIVAALFDLAAEFEREAAGRESGDEPGPGGEGRRLARDFEQLVPPVCRCAG